MGYQLFVKNIEYVVAAILVSVPIYSIPTQLLLVV